MQVLVQNYSTSAQSTNSQNSQNYIVLLGYFDMYGRNKQVSGLAHQCIGDSVLLVDTLIL